MPTDESVDIFLRTLNERFDCFKQNIDSLLQALSGNNPNQKLAAAEQALQSANDLQRSLSSRDQPPWLSPILGALNSVGRHLQNESHCYQLAQALALQYVLIRNHKWSFAEGTSSGFDFDRLYEQFREQSRVPELFDKLIESLEQLSSCPEVDSIRIIRALQKLVETLKKNRRGSYFSTVASWDFVVGLFRNWLWEELCKVPGVGGLLTALRKTLEDTDQEMSRLHTAMQKEVRTQIMTEVALLTYNHRGLPELSMVRQIEDRS